MEQSVLEQYKFLVKLRNSGVTNMWGASPYLANSFKIPHKEAQNVLLGWIKSFNLSADEQPQDGR